MILLVIMQREMEIHCIGMDQQIEEIKHSIIIKELYIIGLPLDKCRAAESKGRTSARKDMRNEANRDRRPGKRGA